MCSFTKNSCIISKWTWFTFCVRRVQRPLLHAGNPDGAEPSGHRGEEREEIQLQEEEGEAGETLQHQRGVTCQLYPGDGSQTGDSEPSVGRALCVVSMRQTFELFKDDVHHAQDFVQICFHTKAVSFVTSALQRHQQD